MGFLSNNLPSFEEYAKKAEWQEFLHPRNSSGEFAPKGTASAVKSWLVDKGIYSEIKYPKTFKSDAEALVWIEKNIASVVKGAAKIKPGTLMEAASVLSLVAQVFPLGKKLSKITIGSGKLHGTELAGFFKSTKTGASIISLSGKLDAERKTIDGLKQAYLADHDAAIKELNKDILQLKAMVKKGNMSESMLSEYKFGIDMNKMTLKSVIDSRKEILKNPPSRLIEYSTLGGADSFVQGAVIHEYGHAWHDAHGAQIKKEFGIRNPFETIGTPMNDVETNFLKYAPTNYGTTNHLEAFAENFTAYVLGEHKKMKPEMVAFFDKHAKI
jgi:hypothetical protein